MHKLNKHTFLYWFNVKNSNNVFKAGADIWKIKIDRLFNISTTQKISIRIPWMRKHYSYISKTMSLVYLYVQENYKKVILYFPGLHKFNNLNISVWDWTLIFHWQVLICQLWDFYDLPQKYSYNSRTKQNIKVFNIY